MSHAVAPPSERQRALTPKERMLVDVVAEAAGQGRELTNSQAGTLAGYGTGETARVAASRAFKRPEVRAALLNRVREVSQETVAAPFAVIRHLATASTSQRTRLEAATKHLAMAGMMDAEAGARGPAVAIQIVLQQGSGTRLAQVAERAGQAVVIEGVAEVERSLAEGEGEAKGRKARRSAPPPPGQPQAGEGHPGVKTAARKSPAVRLTQRAPKNPSGKIPGSGKSGGGSGG